MEKKKGGRDSDTASREEKLKRAFLWATVVAGVVVIALLVVYSPDHQNRFEGGDLSMPVSDTEESPKKPPVSTKHLAELELFPEEGREHVDEGTRVIYKTDPPTSGFHYARWLPPGVHEADQSRPELLVHNLEHGNVVVYFDRDRLSEAELNLLLETSRKYTGQWDGVLLVAKKGMATPLMLTAWRVKMPLKGYDSKKIDDFLDSFRGRGPENPVR